MNKIKNILTDELFRIILGILLFVSAIVVDYLQRHYSFSLFAVVLYIAALLIVGSGVFLDAIKGILRRDLLDEKFLMSIASIGAMIIGDMREGVAVMLFFLIGEYFEHKAVAGSRKSIRNLMDIRPDEVTVLENGVESIVDADEVEVGTTIIIKSGERVPIDAVIISGNADLDTAALTGESLWRAVGTGDEINSGSIVIGGVLICQTIRLAEDSAASRILDLVENAT